MAAEYGPWKVGDTIGEGGQGKVYRTNDPNGKHLAIKVAHLRGGSKSRISRIKQEVEIIKKLQDAPNIIRIYDDNSDEIDESSEAPQKLWYVMDLVKHGSLANNGFYHHDVELSLRLFREILIGMRAAHRAGAIHRDLKPENILLSDNQKSVIIADFGLGKLAAEGDVPAITERDEVLGARFFMAPEQYQHPSAADERSDIYSLGKILYFMLTGVGKLHREHIGDLAKDFIGNNPYLSLIQERLLNKMIQEDPAKRFSEINEIIEVVDDILAVISTNSSRFIRPKGSDNFLYYKAVNENRDEFITNFGANLNLNMGFIHNAIEELIHDGRATALARLKIELLAQNPRGRAKAAAEAVIASASQPGDLPSLSAKTSYSFAPYYQANYFAKARAYEQAHEHILVAIEKETDATLKLRYLLLFSKICTHCKCAHPHNFEARLLELVQAATSAKARADLYKLLGEYYEHNDNASLALRYKEAYLNLQPHDNHERFNCAYAAGELGQRQLSYHHYNLHEKAGSEPDGSTLNNLGALFKKLDAPMKAITYYQQAYELGETIAGSNVASAYLSIGMVDKAREILRDVIVKHPDGDYHERVDSVLGSISTVVEREDEVEAELHKDGTNLSHHNVKSIDALSAPPLNWLGYWELNTKEVIEIAVSGKILQAKLFKSSSTTLPAAPYNLSFKANTAEIKSAKLSSNIYDFGVLYLKTNNNFVGYALKSGKDYHEVSGTRIEDISTYMASKHSLRDTFFGALTGQPSILQTPLTITSPPPSKITLNP